jgi:hypothetical protein
MARKSSWSQLTVEVSRLHAATPTLGRTPLGEWSAWPRELYLTTHNIKKRQISIPSAVFEPAVPASDLLQTHALDFTWCSIVSENKVKPFSCGANCSKSIQLVWKTTKNLFWLRQVSVSYSEHVIEKEKEQRICYLNKRRVVEIPVGEFIDNSVYWLPPRHGTLRFIRLRLLPRCILRPILHFTRSLFGCWMTLQCIYILLKFGVDSVNMKRQ